LLISISERDIQELGKWPINDGLLAKLLKNLLAHDPRVIGVDIFRNFEVPPGSDELRELFSRDIPVVTIMKFGDRTSPGVPAPYMVKSQANVGFADALVDPGGITRRALLFMDDGKISYSSFPLLLASAYLGKEKIGARPDPANPELMQLGKTTFVPLSSDAGGYVNMDAGGYQFLLNFSSLKAGFASISLTEALAGKFDDEAVRDKIVIVGATAESLKDRLSAPIFRSSEQGRSIWGIELHATTVSQLLRAAIDGKKPMDYLSDRVATGWIILWGLLGYVLGLKVSSFGRFALCLLLFSVVLGLTTFLLFLRGLWVPVVSPLLTFLVSADAFRLYQLSVEKRQRALLMHLFECCVSKDIAETIWTQRAQFVEEGLPRPQELTATVQFTDLVGFTTISEQFGDPGKLMLWLNQYMEAMSSLVINHGGVVNKYMGDAIMSIFGVPVARTNEDEISQDAMNAIRCAMAMGVRLAELNSRWQEQGLPTVKMRVGIFTGHVVVGCIGSRQRLEYTVTGDTVNVASRLENFNKNFDAENICRILIGESTWRYSRENFLCRELGSMELRGKGQRVGVYQVLGTREEQWGPDSAAVPHAPSRLDKTAGLK
jgi:adenylate cyclase